MASGDFPVPKFNFVVDIGGTTISFQEVTGLDVENEFTEYRGGNDAEFIPQRRVSIRKSGTLSFKKGIFTDDKKLIDLYKKISDKSAYHSDDSESVDITVTLNDETGAECMTWKALNAVPIKLSTDSLSAQDNSIAIEQIDFSHSGITIE